MNEHERRATTEALFRDVNERIAESAEGFDGDRTEFVCECADPNCTHRVPASLTEYEEVRAEPTTFLLAPGHQQGDIELVVADRGRQPPAPQHARDRPEADVRLDDGALLAHAS